ncbi:small ribosomal subunit Rsm22 family protein [Dongia soli]|uniref:Small ribosomal subunit Rsm22 family protein n=1 Tax=Dongia soli TaxID=600628 RepID=A0ABU5EER8_9PROT|nr:small ribosomal subunit Rsm22 family protein [Dongia soli]MDY0884595.1 small ribosomal subunit Rsm22 family protein [Dongia soli]
MELPHALRQAVDRALDGIALADLAQAAAVLSQRYRAEVRDGRLHLSDDAAALAYLATRLPATFAAIRTSMGEVAERAPDFAPRSLLDIGAGPGSALWAASDCWNGLQDALMIEASPAIRRWGEELAAEMAIAQVRWQAGDLAEGLGNLLQHDLVTLCYVLDELAPAAREKLIDRLWSLTGGILLIVEPGTPAGWQRILDVRQRLIAAGAKIVAPCPHAAACPLIAPDWCHFARRVARSRLHRQAKGAEVPWEDEKFIYLAVARPELKLAEPAPRVIAPPRGGSGRVSLKLCQTDGKAAESLITKRDGALFKAARRVDWGDLLKP